MKYQSIGSHDEMSQFRLWNHARYEAANPGREFEILYRQDAEGLIESVIVLLDGIGPLNHDVDEDFELCE